MTKDENVTGGDGGVWGGSVDASAEGFVSFEDEDTVGAVSVPPLARRSRMTNPCSSSAIVPSLRHSQMSPYPTTGSIRSQAATEIEETVTVGIEWHSTHIRQGIKEKWSPSMSTHFTKVVELMAALRAQHGCPWDRKQTHESLKPYLLEEAYEVIETIDQRDNQKLREELGDVLLQVLFHSQIAAEAGSFTVEDVIETLATKLVRRHPHVFRTGDQAEQAPNSEQVLAQWENIKRAEREAAGNTESALDGVPKILPALLRAYQIQARAARVGFDWPQSDAGLEQVLAKVTEEIGELREALASQRTRAESEPNRTHANGEIENELGDLLFSLVNLARFLKANPEDALRRATNRFIDRFHLVEAQAAEKGGSLRDMTLAEMNRLWDEAKRRLRKPHPDAGDRIP